MKNLKTEELFAIIKHCSLEGNSKLQKRALDALAVKIMTHNKKRKIKK